MMKGISRTRMVYEFNVSMANMVHSSRWWMWMNHFMLDCSSFHLHFYWDVPIFFLNRNPLGQVSLGETPATQGCFVSVKSHNHGFSHQRLWHGWTLESSSTAVECNVVYRLAQRKPIHKRYPGCPRSKTPLDVGNFPHEKIRRKSSHDWEWNHFFLCIGMDHWFVEAGWKYPTCDFLQERVLKMEPGAQSQDFRVTFRSCRLEPL